MINARLKELNAEKSPVKTPKREETIILREDLGVRTSSLRSHEFTRNNPIKMSSKDSEYKKSLRSLRKHIDDPITLKLKQRKPLIDRKKIYQR